MLEPDAAEAVADRQQEIIMIVMLRAEQLDRLPHQLAVPLDLIGRGGRSSGVSATMLSRTPGASCSWRKFVPANIGKSTRASKLIRLKATVPVAAGSTGSSAVP